MTRTDKFVAYIGSWKFLIHQSVILSGYVSYNLYSNHPIDPFPFLFLNIILSFQAAYANPIILISQNRLADMDRENIRIILSTVKKLEATLVSKIDAIQESVDLD